MMERRIQSSNIGLRLALALDGAALTLLMVVSVYMVNAGQLEAGAEVMPGQQLVTLASLIGCVATADKALLRKRTVIIDLLGAATWALAVVLTPIAMLQHLERSVSSLSMGYLLLLWLSLHGAVGMGLACLALWRRKTEPLRRLFVWHRWLAATGLVVLTFPLAAHWIENLTV